MRTAFGGFHLYPSQSAWIVVLFSIQVISQPVFSGLQLQMPPKRLFNCTYGRLQCFPSFRDASCWRLSSRYLSTAMDFPMRASVAEV